MLPIIDFFYPPFRKVMNLQTFRYAASGGANTLLGFLIYIISYEYIFKGREFHFEFMRSRPTAPPCHLLLCNI
jgi:hypothetical protein